MSSEITMAPLTLLGYWFVELTNRLPIGDPFLRSARVAMVLGAIAIALLAWSLVRRGHTPGVAIAIALAAAFEPSMWARITTAPASALATLCVVAAMSTVSTGRWSRGGHLVAASLGVLTGIGFAPSASVATVVSVAAAFAIAALLRVLPVRPVSRAALAAALLVVLVADRLTAPDGDTWRLLAWRDAVEHAMPGAVIGTGDRALAALDGRLFKGRDAGVRLAYVRTQERPPAFVLDDLRASGSGPGTRFERVPLSLPSPAQFLAHVPDGAIVGLAVSQVVASGDSASLTSALRRMGRRATLAGPGYVTFGVLGTSAAIDAFAAAQQLLIGDFIPGTAVRAPVDVQMSAAESGVLVRFGGRDLVVGAAWALILIRPGGPLLAAFAGVDADMAIPVQLDRMAIWRETVTSP